MVLMHMNTIQFDGLPGNYSSVTMSQLSPAVHPPPSFGGSGPHDASLLQQAGLKPEMQRKITLLTRQQPANTGLSGPHHPVPIPTNPLASSVQTHQPVTQQQAYSTSPNMAQSSYPAALSQAAPGYPSGPQAQGGFSPAAQLPSGPQGYPSPPQPGFSGSQLAQLHVPHVARATRDDYYDTEDPSVNLHDFIINSMQAQKNRIILMKLEEEFIKYISDQTRLEPLKCPPWDSYHRMLAHRVAAYFGLEHNVDPVERNCVIVGKGPNTRIPKHRFGDFLPSCMENEMAEPKLILKRSRENSTVEKPQYDVPLQSMSAGDVKTFEEREEEYEKVRARIFSQQPISQMDADQLPFDLGTAPVPRNTNAAHSYWMHHRRTVSDTATAFLSRITEAKKEGTLSNHSSRSATPLISSRPLFLSKESPQASESHSPQVSPGKLVPQQLQSSPPDTSPTLIHTQHPQLQQQQAQLQQQQQQQQQQRNVTSSAMKYPRVRAPQQFGSPLYSTSYPQPLPLLYQQQQDPMAWYYNSMLYSAVPSHTFMPYAQMVQQPLFPVSPVGGQYPVVGTPGLQPANISPIVGQAGLRLPFGMSSDQLGSPSHHPGGVTLVRPVPQQASSIGLSGKPEGFQWNTSLQGFPFQQTPLALTPTSPHPPHTAFTYIPVPLNGGLTSDQQMRLEQQMEALSVSGEGGGGDQGGMEGTRGMYQGGGGAMGLHQGEPPRGAGQESGGILLHQGGYNGEGGGDVLHGPRSSGLYQSGPYAYISNAQGQMMSPTHQGIHFLPPGHIITSQDGQVVQFAMSGQGQRPPPHGGAPSLGPLPLHQPGMLGQPHGHLFSPHNPPGLTQSPVQILGHTLGTSLFSPPPSSGGGPHGMFINSPAANPPGGKALGGMGAPGSPARTAVGSGARVRRYDSPKHSGGEVLPPPPPTSSGAMTPTMSPVDGQQKQGSKLSANGTSPVLSGGPSVGGFQSPQLPPRLIQQQQQQQQQRNTGTRYQNQRHPANRGMGAAVVVVGKPAAIETSPLQFSPPGAVGSKKEPLLPTPPSSLKVKLDTNLTCGVPLNVMELLKLPPEGSPELQQAMQRLTELGVVDLKRGGGKRGDAITIAIFDSPESAARALHQQCSMFTLSIPQSNHAKGILALIGLGTP